MRTGSAIRMQIGMITKGARRLALKTG